MPSVGDFSKWVPALTVCKSCTVKLTGISFFTGGANAAAFSDIKIVYGKSSERSIRLHRIILCNDNAYFMNAIGPDSEWAEAGKTEITLHDDDANALEMVFRWLYRPNSLTVTEAMHPETAPACSFYLEVFRTADKYLVPGLRLEMAKRIRALADAADGNTDKVVEVVLALYEGDVTGKFKSIMHELIRQNGGELIKLPEVKQALDEDKGLTWEFLSAFAKVDVGGGVQGGQGGGSQGGLGGSGGGRTLGSN